MCFMTNNKLKILFCLSLIITLGGCKKFLEIDGPPTSTNADVVFGNDADANAAVSNLYIKLSAAGITDPTSFKSLALFTGLSADELQPSPTNATDAYRLHFQNSLSASAPGTADYWTNGYAMIATCNEAIEGLTNSKTLTPAIKTQLLGEAKFMRAFCYYYLVNIYGAVPLNLTTDYKANSTRPRTSVDVVYAQIIDDLKIAKDLLSEDYRTAAFTITGERVKPNKAVASSLLARVYLHLNDLANAEQEATSIVERKTSYDLVDADDVFTKNSKETMWALQPILANMNTSDAQLFLPSASQYQPVYLTADLANSFLATDSRKISWMDSTMISGIKYYYSKKYKNRSLPGDDVTEYTIVMRIAEQYLIRAEARLGQGRLYGANSAESDLNALRMKRGLNPIPAGYSQQELLMEILKEKRRELFVEWGHRWVDLKRLNRANEILSPLKGANWQTTDQLYPIPLLELNGNPSISGNQNPGY